VVEIHKPDIIVSSFTTVPQSNSVDAYLDRLATDFSSTTIMVSGIVLKKLKNAPKSNVHIFYKALEIKDLIRKINLV
jgi:hypothetical protein